MTDLVPWQANPDVLERVGRCNEIYHNLLTVNRAFLCRLLDLLLEIHDLIGAPDNFRDLVDSQLSWLAGRDVVAMVALWREARKERALRELASLQPDATISLFAGVPADTDTDRLLALLQMPPGERRRALAGAPAPDETAGGEVSVGAHARRGQHISALADRLTVILKDAEGLQAKLQAELAAHAGDRFYRRRCDNALAQLDRTMAVLDSICAILLEGTGGDET